MCTRLNILILEDEEHARNKLIDLLTELYPHTHITWKHSVADGISYLQQTSLIDLIFSDIELLDGNVFNIFAQVKPPCPIIFCTAYDTFYVEAFQTNGIAYLLKPYSKEQLQDAWGKYEALYKKNRELIISPELITKIKREIDQESRKYKKMFSVKKRDGVFLLKVDQVAYFQAQGDFVLAIDFSNSKHVLNYSLSAIEGLINPKQFFRINRSEIVNLHSIHKYSSYTKNRLLIHLANSRVILYTTNSRTPEFRNWIDNQ